MNLHYVYEVKISYTVFYIKILIISKEIKYNKPVFIKTDLLYLSLFDLYNLLRYDFLL